MSVLLMGHRSLCKEAPACQWDVDVQLGPGWRQARKRRRRRWKRGKSGRGGGALSKQDAVSFCCFTAKCHELRSEWASQLPRLNIGHQPFNSVIVATSCSCSSRSSSSSTHASILFDSSSCWKVLLQSWRVLIVLGRSTQRLDVNV